MRTQDYLKIVVDNLRLAAQTRKQEIDELQRSIARHDQDYKNHMHNMKLSEAESLERAAVAGSDTERGSRLRDAQIKRIDESREKSDFERFKRDVDNEMAIKRRNYDDINRTLQSIEQGWLNL